MLILPPQYAKAGVLDFQRPEPKPEMEARVRPVLKAIDELLDIRWFENIVYNERHKGYEGRYALVCRWPSADPRWGMIQKGEIGNDPYDILGWYTEDQQDGASTMVDPEMFESRTMQLLASADNTRTPWKQRLAQVAQKNIDRKAKLKSDFLENEVHDLASHYRNAGLGVQQISVPKEIK